METGLVSSQNNVKTSQEYHVRDGGRQSAGKLRRQHIAVVQSWDEQIVAHGREVHQGTEKDKAVPDGVRKWYQPVTLEEDDAGDVDGSTDSHLVNTGVLALNTNTNQPHSNKN